MIKVLYLNLYPIKGMKGTSVNSAKVLERGFEHDRRYMLVEEDGTFISQRTHSQLVFFEPQILGDELVVHYKDKSIGIKLSSSLQNTISTTIFDAPVSATEVSIEANSWFSAILNQNVRLVKMCEKDIRYKELIKGPKQVEVSFADGYPYLIVGTESLNKLNTLLEKPLKLERFRANIIVETAEPHVEDSWDEIEIGNAHFLVVKPCGRCPVVTVDQLTGEKSNEPLKTLATYRKKDNNVYFGANTISRGDGYVHVGDEVVIL